MSENSGLHRKNRPWPQEFKEFNAEIGDRIRLVRKRNQMSLSYLGESIGVTYQQMQKYEAGTNRISASSLIYIAGALNTDPASLLAGLTPAGREGDDDARAELAVASDSRRLSRLFAALNSDEDRDLIVNLAAYLAAREERRRQSLSAETCVD